MCLFSLNFLSLSLQVIEIFGIFTKPAALCVRLFCEYDGWAYDSHNSCVADIHFCGVRCCSNRGSLVVSIAFTMFMLALDVLVSFIQAYVFTMLSTMFISMAQEEEREHKDNVEALVPDAVEA